MDRYERILTLHRILKSVRDALGAPIENGDGAEATVRYAADEADRFELPGLWLSSEELAALLALNELLSRSDPGVLAGALAPFRARIERLLSDHSSGRALPIERIRVLASGSRTLDQAAFRTVASSLLNRTRLKFRYRARSTDAQTERVVSPQRLAHYRDNWYLDAWDHSREALRSFALDRIRDPLPVDEVALDRESGELDAHLAASYGIFSGAPRAWATIRFSPHASRWVADEHWHSQQQGTRMPDVLKYGPDAEVVAPVSLREEMKILLQLALGAYQTAQ
jgi:predicted DNA-binding transcriptional regulator YafY